mmetsp:Transcript_6649/g.8227  ORF Transcript_6649/g.8227 Transcript_6649/m.8227 type:complete len:236 (-) Transcript_6649:24-731(-)
MMCKGWRVSKSMLTRHSYFQYSAAPDPTLNTIKISCITPASKADILKKTEAKEFLISETIDTYNRVVEPFIASIPASKIQWIQNIFDHTAEEAKRIHTETSEFIILPDFHWLDLEDTDHLYLLLISNNSSLRSLRDLNGDTLPLLRRMDEEIKKCIATRYPSVDVDQVNVFFHYRPTFYRLHLHITKDAIKCHPSRVHYLSTVIQNIALKSDYYQTVSLPCCIKENDALYSKISE